uniref:Signal peptidase complex catalytic subunit SEC11 n=1 Tax=Paramormyrops kingsleyae TaxID=1676925 RepID=A0A3B3S5T2_9TELE
MQYRIAGCCCVSTDNLSVFEFRLYYQVLNFSVIVSSAIMILKGLMVVTVFNSISSPQITCLPAFHHGDDLFLTNNTESPIRAGETVVFRIEGRETPIVKGVLKIHEN